MQIGFIGLGIMGQPMAKHLLNAGHTLHLWARKPETLAPWNGLRNVTIHPDASQLARHTEMIITMLSDTPDVEEVILGKNGLAEGIRQSPHESHADPKKSTPIFIDMSTIAPSAARKIGQQLESQGIDFLDAPVSGGQTGAQQAMLTIMVGGKENIFEQVRPILEKLGRTLTYIGPTGSGQVAKACNQILTGIGIAAVAEALHFARTSGVDPARVREALMGGFAGSRILEAHGQRMLNRDFQPGFKAWMHQKDLRIVMNEAQSLGLALPETALTSQLFNALVDSGHGEEDSIALLKLLEELSGT